MGIILKSQRELDKMREAGRIVSAVLDAVEAACVPGVTTLALNDIAKRELARAKARSAFLGYRPGGAPPYPAVLCTSVNRVVVHGIPSRRECLREGDLIGIDFACFKDGYCADAARTVAEGGLRGGPAPHRRRGVHQGAGSRPARHDPGVPRTRHPGERSRGPPRRHRR